MEVHKGLLYVGSLHKGLLYVGSLQPVIGWRLRSTMELWTVENHKPADSLPVFLIRLALVATSSRVKKVACSCIDALTGERLSVRVYKKKHFVQLASILLTSCPGVNSPLHVISSDDEVITACKKTYGDLHEFLKSKKMLTEAQAAPLFRQIVDLVKHSHRQGIVLRDLKLKKLVFVDSER